MKTDLLIGQTIIPNRLEIIKNKIQNCKNPTLHLDNLGISDNEIEAIVNEINDRQHIVILHLSNNHISDIGANLLVQHLINVCAVVLDGNNLTTVGAAALIQCEKFTLIDLEDNPINYDENLYSLIIQSQNLTKILLEDTGFSSDVFEIGRHFAKRRENLKKNPANIAEKNVLHMVKMINRLLVDLVTVGRDYLADTLNPCENDRRIAECLVALGSHFDDINEQKYNYNNVLIPQWIPMPITLTGMKERCLIGKLSGIFINASCGIPLNYFPAYSNDIDPNLYLKVRSVLASYPPFKKIVSEMFTDSNLDAQRFKHYLIKLNSRLLSLSLDPSPPGMHYLMSRYRRDKCRDKKVSGANIEEPKQSSISLPKAIVMNERSLVSQLRNWCCFKPKPIRCSEEKPEEKISLN